MKAVVTGGAGFIGSHVAEYLVLNGFEVVIIDNLSSGSLENISHITKNKKVKLLIKDLKIFDSELRNAFSEVDTVYHFAANPEVRVSMTEPRIHFEENVLITFNVLENCRLNDVKEVVFASSSTVYGDAQVFPTPEDYPTRPISIYGVSKLMSENLITGYSDIYGVKALTLRFANIVGPRQTHGVIVDFINKLRKNPKKLEILGDGTQKKSYLHVKDLIDGMHVALEHLRRSSTRYEVYNVGNIDWITVKEIADLVVEEMGLSKVEYVFKPATHDGRGWLGDVKFMLLDVRKLMSLGWTPKLSSKEALREAIRWVKEKS
ncbi:MAG: NAD-dependent epimerase/dehydratase family protein [Desulfurococcaceae archaeon TW002]